MATDKKGLSEPMEQIKLPVFVKELNKKSSCKIFWWKRNWSIELENMDKKLFVEESQKWFC